MKKKLPALLLALCMVFSLLPFGAAAAGFQDVKPGAYYYDAVDWALNHDPQITKGTSDATFSPDSTCRRCEVVTFLWRSFGAEKATGENPFADVKATDYYYDAAVWAVSKGVTTGTDAAHFSPDEPCTREQVATFLWRAAGKPASTVQAPPFADMMNKDWYAFTPILWAFENGVTTGKTVNTFAPKDPCTRAQIVTFLFRALSRPLTPPETDGRLHFRPKVASQFLVEVFGEQMVRTWFDLVDAVMAGKDTFPCPDQYTYNWVMGQFPNKCFPVLVEVIDYAYDRTHSVHDGVGSFTYRVPREEAAKKIAAFAELVEDILNKTMKPGDSDFEKALSLFRYFQATYTYDYAAAADLEKGKADYVSTYRVLTGKTGICHEIANAYSYLLMQAGVNTTTAMGGNHEWSYLRLNGKNFHSDPTYALGRTVDELLYFLMTDDERCGDGEFRKDGFTYTSSYWTEVPHRDYIANDGTFSDIRRGFFDSFDHENQILHYTIYSDLDGILNRTISFKGY